MIRFLVIVLGQVLLLFSASNLMGQALEHENAEAGRDAIRTRSYPWFDRTAESIQKVKFPERPKSRTANRSEIPVAPPTPNTANRWNWNGGGLLGGLSWVAWTVIGILIALVLAVMVWAFMRLESGDEETTSSKAARSIEESIKQLPFELESKTGDFLDLAKEAYSHNDLKKAIIYLFSHVLVSLDQKNLIRLRKGKTNRQYLRELKSHRELSNYYQHVMVPFEATFFGDHELSSNEFSTCWNRLDSFQTNIANASQVTDE